MVIDTSAIVAIAFNEPDAEDFELKIIHAPRRFMSTASVLELSMVLETRLGEAGAAELDLWLHKAGVEIIAFDEDQLSMARRAWQRFGKGRHKAGLNYGDCFSYALAKSRGEPLLFKGDDFTHTDIDAA
ncbi:MAG: type II toxin-antitoxin system VapC family toxin [Proteobacteria bacterium]|jgi:ribonuclease VapC|nr:type II toxin-antitoxin system VapC family toxin [Pseudomonadota bacterium]